MSQRSKYPFLSAAAFTGFCYDWAALLSIQLSATPDYVESVDLALLLQIPSKCKLWLLTIPAQELWQPWIH